MPAGFESVEKFCLNCGYALELKNSRDIKRKRFCSRACLATYLWKVGILKGHKASKETKEKMRQSKLRLLSQGWIPVGWKKYIIKPRIGTRVRYWFVGHKRQHRILMEEKLGRKLLKEECVHHKNGNKLDNSINNLEVMMTNEHTKLHNKQRRLEYVTESI